MSCYDCRSTECLHFGNCNNNTGTCDCPIGFGGQNCSEPVCGSLDIPNSERPLRGINSTCECTSEFTGINCNMCTTNSSCKYAVPSLEANSAVCLKSGILVNENFHMCNVTNPKLLDILNGRRAEVSFNCELQTQKCDFQLWVDQVESFYCQFANCSFNGLEYHCPKVNCKCKPGELLCGQDGSLDLSEWLEKSVKGPADLKCNSDLQCSFEEPEMDNLIRYILGDSSIQLNCLSSECLHKSQVPGYLPPVNDGTSVQLLFVFFLFAFVLVFLVLSFFQKRNLQKQLNLSLPSEVNIGSVAPVGVYFDQLSYTVDEKVILNDVSGFCPPGSVLAIMGGSGAGKTTLLDLLAGKHKLGVKTGQVRLNGDVLNPNSMLRQLIGFVDQNDDILVKTQTVYEHVLFSALLRLPSSMSLAAKEQRVLETLKELKIDHIRDQLVGSGLSGGEKRRLCIACELVTSPSVLLLDEPTSGLDAFNAYQVIENLVSLAKNSNRTVIFTIHQPRSNIVQLFDKILLLSNGQLAFTGTVDEAEIFFEQCGHKCPLNYNIADFMIDVTMDSTTSDTVSYHDNVSDDVLSEISADCLDPEVHSMPLEVDADRQWQDSQFHRQQLSMPQIPQTSANAMLQSNLSFNTFEPIASQFRSNELFENMKSKILESKQIKNNSDFVKRASFLTQFRIISSRIFSNLHRDRMLLFTHYGISLVLGVLCGFLYFHVSNDIPGFQNRLGLFFFLLAVFGFSTLTTISLFMAERLTFVQERANGYYHPLPYYMAKVLLDVVPLRVGPPVLLSLILYPLVGLNSEEAKAPLVFVVVLTLFNLSASSLMLVVGIVFADYAVGSLVGCMIHLFGILFAGLFLNQESTPTGANWAKWVSIYHYAYEALAVNEVKHLTLTEEKFGLKIEVPGATILSAFGFDNMSLNRNIMGLVCAAILSVVVGYFCVERLLIERR